MNNSAFRRLCHQKGIQTMKVGGLHRAVIGGQAQIQSHGLVLAIQKMKDLAEVVELRRRKEEELKQKAVDLTEMSQEERDAQILEMMDKPK